MARIIKFTSAFTTTRILAASSPLGIICIHIFTGIDGDVTHWGNAHGGLVAAVCQILYLVLWELVLETLEVVEVLELCIDP